MDVQARGRQREVASLARLLTRAERLAARRTREAVEAEADCSLDAWQVLDLLADGVGRPMSEIAARVALPAASLTRLVDQLVDRNLLYRRGDPLDRRKVLVRLTPRGEDLARRLGARVARAWSEVLDAPDQAELRAALVRFVEALDAPEPTRPLSP